MCVAKLEECDCGCHRWPGGVHVGNCCMKCPHCDRRIKLALFDMHVQRCKEMDEAIMDSIAKGHLSRLLQGGKWP